MKTKRPRFELTLEALDDPQAAVLGERFTRDEHYRLRRALKVLLRSFGLRCVSVGPAGDGAQEASVEPLAGDVAA